jgi:hypothetical protein
MIVGIDTVGIDESHGLSSDQSGSKWLEPFVGTGDRDRQKQTVNSKRRGGSAGENFCERPLNTRLSAPKKAQQMCDSGKNKGKLKADQTAVRITLEGKVIPLSPAKPGSRYGFSP